MIYSSFGLNNTRSGLAKKTDEYEPKNIPAARVIANTLVDSGPKKNKASKTIIVESDVLIDRAYVSVKLLPTTSLKSVDDFLVIFSRTRSNTTIVSFTESPKIVRSATTKRVSTSDPIKVNTPVATITS